MDIAREDKKVDKEPEFYDAKEIVKTVAKKNIDSIALFSEIYEKHKGEKVSFNVCWTSLCLLILMIFIYNTLNIEFIIQKLILKSLIIFY